MQTRPAHLSLRSGALLALLFSAPSVFAEDASPPEQKTAQEAATPATSQEASAAPPQAKDSSPENSANEESDVSAEDSEATSPEAEQAPEVPEVDPYAEAKERVGRGEQLYKDGNFDAALTEFQRAYETMLGHPARSYVLFNVGRCQEKLYRYTDAVSSYKRYLEEAGEKAQDRGTVQAKVELLEGLLGTLKVNVTFRKSTPSAGYEIWVDGRLLGKDAKSLLIPGGTHQVEVRAVGFETVTQQVQLPSRAEKTIDFELSPLAEEYHGLPRTYFWTATGLAVGTAAVGGVFGVLAVSESSSVKNKESEAITDDDVKKVDNLALTADILFISAGVFAVSATVLGFLTDWSDQEATVEDHATLRLKQFGLLPVQGGATLSVGGSF